MGAGVSVSVRVACQFGSQTTRYHVCSSAPITALHLLHFTAAHYSSRTSLLHTTQYLRCATVPAGDSSCESVHTPLSCLNAWNEVYSLARGLGVSTGPLQTNLPRCLSVSDRCTPFGCGSADREGMRGQKGWCGDWCQPHGSNHAGGAAAVCGGLF